MMYKVKGVDDNKWPVVRLLVVTIHSGRRSMVRHCRGICGCSKSCWMALKVEIASVQEPDYVGPWGREKDAARPPFFFQFGCFWRTIKLNESGGCFLNKKKVLVSYGLHRVQKWWCLDFSRFFCGVNEMYAVNIFWGGTGRTSEIIGFLFKLWLTVAS